MTNKKHLLLSLGFFTAVLVVSGCTLSPGRETPAQTHQQTTYNDHQKYSFQLQDKTLTLEVVNTSESITLGLSGREAIGSDGMLFILGKKAQHRFWMKEMQFDLDLIWLADGQIVDISHDVPKPAPGTPLSQLPTFFPKSEADMVLEVPAGKAKEWNLQVGDHLSSFPSSN